MSQDKTEEIKRINKVADMLVSCHIRLKEKYISYSFMVDVSMFVVSVFLCVFAFSSDDILAKYLGEHFKFLLGIFSIGTFVMAYCADKFNWKIRAEQHRQAAEKYFEFKADSKNILNSLNSGGAPNVDIFIEKYNSVANTLVTIPERDFLKCKQHHLSKVEISRWLDEHPGGSILIFKIKRFFRDNK